MLLAFGKKLQLSLWYNYIPKANNIKGFDQLRLWYNYLPKAYNILGFDQLRL
jgi:hypothetical protein